MRVVIPARLGALIAAVAVFAACGGGPEQPAGLGAGTSPPAGTTTEAPRPTPPAPAETGIVDVELPEGFTLVDVPDVDGAEAAALRAYLQFEAYYWQALIDNEVPDQLDRVAAAAVVQRVETHVAQQRDQEMRLGGERSLSPRVEAATENVAFMAACNDQSRAVAVSADGTESVPESMRDAPTFTTEAELNNTGTGWQVIAFDIEVEPC